MTFIGKLSVCLSASVLLLSGCGTRAPDIKEIWDGPAGTAQIEFEIKKRVFCDLREAVHAVNRNELEIFDPSTGTTRKELPLPEDWGAQVSLLLQVDESSALNPGLTYTQVRPNSVTTFAKYPDDPVKLGQSFALGANATVSSVATRIDRFNTFYTMRLLNQKNTKSSACVADPYETQGIKPARSSPLIVSDLGIKGWLQDAVLVNSMLPSDKPGASPGQIPADTISLQVKFVIVTGGNVTPAWKLIPVSVNAGALPLFATSRTRTHDLLITIGPQKNGTSEAHFAAQISQALNSGVPPRQ